MLHLAGGRMPSSLYPLGTSRKSGLFLIARRHDDIGVRPGRTQELAVHGVGPRPGLVCGAHSLIRPRCCSLPPPPPPRSRQWGMLGPYSCACISLDCQVNKALACAELAGHRYRAACGYVSLRHCGASPPVIKQRV